MRRSSAAEFSLSLFTTRERAREIEGDLLEQQKFHPVGWLVWQVVAVTAALFLSSSREAAVRIAMLGALLTGLAFAAGVGVERWLLAPDAWFPAPFLGLIGVVFTAFMIGWAAGYFGLGPGLRAAAWTCLALTSFFGIKALATFAHPLVAIAYLGVSLAIQPTPLLVGGVIGFRQSRSL